MRKSFVVTLGLLSAGDVALTLTSCTLVLGIGQLAVGPLSD